MSEEEEGRRRRGRHSHERGVEVPQSAPDELPPIKDATAEGRRRRNRIAPTKSDEATATDEAEAASREGDERAASREGDESKRRGRGRKREKKAEEGPQTDDLKPTLPPFVHEEEEEHWDLVMIIDPKTDDETEATKELDALLGLLRHEGLKMTRRVLMEESEGACGRVLCLCTAVQEELEQEAELMSITKPLKIPAEVAKRFNKSTSYARVSAPFTRARRDQFHEVPFLDAQDNIRVKGTGPDDDRGNLIFFSPCERQNLLEHIIEAKIREAVHLKVLSPNTGIQIFPLHDDDGDGNRDVTWLRKHWVNFFRRERWTAVLCFWRNPHLGLNEPLHTIREYFGDQITMYFAFLSFYTRWLVYPALIGFAFQIWLWADRGFDLMNEVVPSAVNGTNSTNSTNSNAYSEGKIDGGLMNASSIGEAVQTIGNEIRHNSSDWAMVAYCIFICVWASLFIKFWERKQSALAYYWFTSELHLEEKVRREFYIKLDEIDSDPPASHAITAEDAAKMVSGNEDGFSNIHEPVELKPSNVRKLNKKTGQLEEKFPKSRRAIIYSASIGSIAILVACVGIIFVYFYLINVIATYVDCSMGQVLGSVCHSVLIIVTSSVYRALASKLNEWENHRTDVKFENSLIFKVFVFEFVNNFLAMFWIAFMAPYFCQEMDELEKSLSNVSSGESCLATATASTTVPCDEKARIELLSALQTKIGTLIITRMVVSNIVEVGGPAFKGWMAKRYAQSKGKEIMKDGTVEGGAFGHEDETVRVVVEGGEFGIGRNKKNQDEHAVGESEKGKEGNEGKDEGGDHKENQKEGKDAEKGEEGDEVVGKNGENAKSDGQGEKKEKIKLKKVQTITKEKKDFPPKSRGWWMCKGKAEDALEEYGDGGDACTLDDYNEIVIQFCFVCLFGVAFPITALLALISNLVEMYVDAMKLCNHMRRPLAQRVSSIPATWMGILKIVAMISIITNIVILFQNSESIKRLVGVDNSDGTSMWVAAFVLEHMIIVVLLWFMFSVPNEPKGITKLKNLSKRIQRAVLVHGREHVPLQDDDMQAQGTGSLSPSVSVQEVGGRGRQKKEDVYDADGLAALQAINEGLSREQMAAAAEGRAMEAQRRGASKRGAGRRAAKLQD